jgi:hypothetical protein
MRIAGIEVVDSSLVTEAVELARDISPTYLFHHVMRSWLFATVIDSETKSKADPELVALAAVLHDLGLTEQHVGEERFEVDSANAARSFLQGKGLGTGQIQLIWDAIALHSTRSIALNKEPEVAAAHRGIALDVIGIGLGDIDPEKIKAILAAYPRLSMKRELLSCLCSVVRQKPDTTYDNFLREIGERYVEGYAAPTFPELLLNAPFEE